MNEGTLKLVNNKWYVQFNPKKLVGLFLPNRVDTDSIPLHPDDLVSRVLENGEFVQFKVVQEKEMCNGYKNQPKGVIGFVASYEMVDYAKLKPIFNTETELTLYSEIENLIMRYDSNGKETAGSLTRQIMKLINKK